MKTRSSQAEALNGRNEGEQSSAARVPWVWPLTLLSIGLVLILGQIYVTHEIHLNVLVGHVGVALVVSGVVSFLIELPDYKSYAEGLLRDLVMGRGYLNTLDRERLQRMRFDIDSCLLGTATDEIGTAGNFYDFAHNRFQKALGSCHRTNYLSQTIYQRSNKATSELKLPPEYLFVNSSIDYKLLGSFGKVSPRPIAWNIALFPRALPLLDDECLISGVSMINKIKKNQESSALDRELMRWIQADQTLASKFESTTSLTGEMEAVIKKPLINVLSKVCNDAILAQDCFLKKDTLTQELVKLIDSGIPQAFRSTINRLILHNHFRNELCPIPIPSSIFFFELEVSIRPPERLIKEIGEKEKIFRFDPIEFALLNSNNKTERIELGLHISTEEKLQIIVSFSYDVPYWDKLFRNEGIDVKITSKRGVLLEGESLSFKMNMPTKDPLFTFIFPEDIRTDVSWFGYMSTGYATCNPGNATVRFDGWVLPGHGVSLAWYPPPPPAIASPRPVAETVPAQP